METVKKARLVLQGKIANVFVDTYQPGIEKRILQSDRATCESFCKGLEAAGAEVTIWSCEKDGDAALWESYWKPEFLMSLD